MKTRDCTNRATATQNPSRDADRRRRPRNTSEMRRNRESARGRTAQRGKEIKEVETGGTGKKKAGNNQRKFLDKPQRTAPVENVILQILAEEAVGKLMIM